MIFVVGNSRSGTTMLARVLGRHPRVFTFEELHFFEQVWDPAQAKRELGIAKAGKLAARLLSHQRDGILSGGSSNRFMEEAVAVIDSMEGECSGSGVFEAVLQHEAALHGKDIPCDQTPKNLFYVTDLLRLYPTSRVVIMVRDPRDVLASQKRKWKMRFLGHNRDPLSEALRVKVNYHPVTTSLLWNAAVRAGDRVAADERVFTMRFEDIINDPAKQIRRICDFLGLSFESGMLDVAHVNSSFEKPKDGQRGISKTAAGRWRSGALSATELYICQRLAADGMRRHGYEAAEVRPGLLALALSLISLPAKATLALILNAGKMRSLPHALQRRFAS